MAKAELYWDAAALAALESAAATLEEFDGGSNVDLFVRAFDYATDEYANLQFQVPGEIDTSGTVTFRLYWFARTCPNPAENVLWAFEHSARNGGEDYDAAYTQEVASADSTGTTQDALVETVWTETVSNLGWAANDTVFGKILRKVADAADTFDSAGGTDDDALLVGFAIEIPLAAA